MQQPLPVPQDGTPSASGQVRRYIRSLIAGKSDVSIPSLVDATIDWLTRDRPLLVAFLRESLTAMVYEVVQRVLATTRADLMLLGENLMEKQEVIAQASLKWATWMERGATRHVAVLEMDRQDCFAAAAHRFLNSERHLALATLWRSVGDNLADGERVGDRFTVEDLEVRLQNIQAQSMELANSDRSWARRLLGRREI